MSIKFVLFGILLQWQLVFNSHTHLREYFTTENGVKILDTVLSTPDMLTNLFYKLKLINCMCSVLYNHMKAFMISSTTNSYSSIFFYEKRSMWVMNLIFDWNIASSNYIPDSWYHHLLLSEMCLLMHWFIHLTDIHLMLSMWQVLPLTLEIHENRGNIPYNMHSKWYP